MDASFFFFHSLLLLHYPDEFYERGNKQNPKCYKLVRATYIESKFHDEIYINLTKELLKQLMPHDEKVSSPQQPISTVLHTQRSTKDLSLSSSLQAYMLVSIILCV